MFNLFKKKPQTIQFYVVTPNISKDDTSFNFLTVTTKKELCEEYINRRLFIEHKDHYVSWCGLREIDYKDKKSWFSYVSSTDSVPMNKYIINKVTYSIDDVATIFRLYNNCMPIGTSYEDDFEVGSFLESLKKDAIENLIIKMNDKKSEEEKLDK